MNYQWMNKSLWESGGPYVKSKPVLMKKKQQTKQNKSETINKTKQKRQNDHIF